MITKFNVLPDEYRAKHVDKKLNLLAVFFPVVVLSFIVAFSFVLGMGLFKYRSLSKELEAATLERDVLKMQGEKLLVELSRLKEKESLISATTNLLKGDIPLLELFKQIELSLPGGVWLSSLSAESEKAQINGYSYNENDVVLFATGLMQSPIVGQVGFPNTRRINMDGRSLVEFKLSCTLVMP